MWEINYDRYYVKKFESKKRIKSKKLGNILFLARNTISSYERGNSQPDFKTIIKILDICGYELQLLDKKTKNVIDINRFSREI